VVKGIATKNQNSSQNPAQPKNPTVAPVTQQAVAPQHVTGGQNEGTAATPATSQRIPASLDAYSTEDMLKDVENYHNLCSFFAGVTGLTQSTSTYSPLDVNTLIKTIKDTANGTSTSPGQGPTKTKGIPVLILQRKRINEQ
jgi:hypothetical protein